MSPQPLIPVADQTQVQSPFSLLGSPPLFRHDLKTSHHEPVTQREEKKLRSKSLVTTGLSRFVYSYRLQLPCNPVEITLATWPVSHKSVCTFIH